MKIPANAPHIVAHLLKEMGESGVTRSRVNDGDVSYSIACDDRCVQINVVDLAPWSGSAEGAD